MRVWPLLLLSLALGCKSEPTASSSSSNSAKPALPGPEAANAQAPASYRAKFQTSKGDFVVEVQRAWAPNGADRFYNLVKIGFFDGTRFFRVVPGFVVQWGIHGDGDAVMSRWRDANIPDDPVVESNKPGTITFATAGPGTRSTQVFVNFGDNSRLDATGFSPFGKIVSGMEVVTALNAAHGQSPDQGRIQREGNAYLDRAFPGLDYVKKAEIVP
jgi:peptidyl-prolyl cis-trans isomerase A (cyclophilin A)